MGKHFLWDPVEDNIVKEIDDAGSTVADYTTEPYLYGDLISQHRDGQSSFYHYDGQGSTTSLTDSAGNITDIYTYSAFGEVTDFVGSIMNSFLYIARQGYYYRVAHKECMARRRLYSVLLSRWLSIDPSQLHLASYGYVNNAPIHFQDPSGLGPCDPGEPIGKEEDNVGGTVACINGSLRAIILIDGDVVDGMKTKIPRDPCLIECTYTHENIHVKQFNKLCPGFCDPCSKNRYVPYWPMKGKDLDIYECEAYKEGMLCLVEFLLKTPANCDRVKINDQLKFEHKIVKEHHKCLWAQKLFLELQDILIGEVDKRNERSKKPK